LLFIERFILRKFYFFDIEILFKNNNQIFAGYAGVFLCANIFIFVRIYYSQGVNFKKH